MKTYFLIFFFGFVQQALFGQLSLSVNMTFEPDPDVLAWAAHPETVQLTVTNNSEQTLEYKYLARLIYNGQVILDNDPAKMPKETIGPFETRVSFAEDVFPSEAVEIHGNSAETYMKTNTIPGGQYLICVKLINLAGQELSPDNCRPFQITSYQQPALIYPTASSPVTAIARPVFSWSPTVPMPAFPILYRLKVVEVPLEMRDGHIQSFQLPGVQAPLFEYEWARGAEVFYPEGRVVTGVWLLGKRTGVRDAHDKYASQGHTDQLSTETMRALNYGFPLIDVELMSQTQFQWPVELPDPEPGRSYVWSVQALRSDNGQPVGDNNGVSQPAEFFVTEEGANANDALPGTIAPGIIIADENGCLYGCTGNVWQEIDCPPERMFSGPDTYPSTFLLAEAKEGSDKKWILLDETTGEPLSKEPMLAKSRFVLLDKVEVNSSTAGKRFIDISVFKIDINNTIIGKPATFTYDVLDKAANSFKLQPVTEFDTPNSSQSVSKTTNLPEVTLEQIQPFIDEFVKAKEPMYLNLNNDGTLTKVKSLADCAGDYCLTLTSNRNSSQADEPVVKPSLRIWICTVYENPNGMFPKIDCHDLQNLLRVDNIKPPIKISDPYSNMEGTFMPDVDDGTIVLRMNDGRTICLKADGTIGECGELPSAKELKQLVKEANEKIISSNSEVGIHGHEGFYDPECLQCQKSNFDKGTNDNSVQMDKVQPYRVKTSDKHQKAVMDFIKGMPISTGNPDDDWTELETPSTIILCLQNGKVSPITNCRNCPGNCIVLKKAMFHGSADSFTSLRQMTGAKECQKCKKGDCPDHQTYGGKHYFRITEINTDNLTQLNLSSSSSPILMSLSPTGELLEIKTEAECPKGYFLLTLEASSIESNVIRG